MDDKMKAELVRGMFSNCTFQDSVVAGIAESGSEVFYEKRSEPRREAVESPSGKEAIMEYVGRLKPMVREEYLAGYDDLWLGILELKEVKAVIYNKGKQQDTTFNRNLLAQIIHQVGTVYKPTANTVQMAQCLEPVKGVDHPVRQKLGEVPDKPIKRAVDNYLKENLP